MADYSFDLPVRQNQLEAIGMVAAEWSYLESIVDAAIWEYSDIRIDGVGEAITTHLSISVRLGILTTVFHVRCDEWVNSGFRSKDEVSAQKREFKSIRKAVDTLAGQRNKVIHARWVRGAQGSPMTYVVQARGVLKRNRIGMPDTEIRRIAQEIAELSKKLQLFFGIEEDVDE